MLTEKQKYELVWRKVKRYGKDWTNPGLAGSMKRWIKKEIPEGSSVTDFGCGNGTSLAWMKSIGLNPRGVEIAGNATNRNDVVIGDLRQPLNLEPTDYGICADMMEHIPTVDVDSVLKQIAATVQKKVLFVIARDEDKDGAQVDQILHLTRQPLDWWSDAIKKHFKQITVLHYDPDKETAISLWAEKC